MLPIHVAAFAHSIQKRFDERVRWIRPDHVSGWRREANHADPPHPGRRLALGLDRHEHATGHCVEKGSPADHSMTRFGLYLVSARDCVGPIMRPSIASNCSLGNGLSSSGAPTSRMNAAYSSSLA